MWKETKREYKQLINIILLQMSNNLTEVGREEKNQPK